MTHANGEQMNPVDPGRPSSRHRGLIYSQQSNHQQFLSNSKAHFNSDLGHLDSRDCWMLQFEGIPSISKTLLPPLIRYKKILLAFETGAKVQSKPELTSCTSSDRLGLLGDADVFCWGCKSRCRAPCWAGSTRCLCPANAVFDVPRGMGLNAKHLGWRWENICNYCTFLRVPQIFCQPWDGAAASAFDPADRLRMVWDLSVWVSCFILFTLKTYAPWFVFTICPIIKVKTVILSATGSMFFSSALQTAAVWLFKSRRLLTKAVISLYQRPGSYSKGSH